MSKLVKFFAIAALVAGAFAMTPGPAAAQHHHGGAAIGMAAAAIGVAAGAASDPALPSASVPAGAGAAIPIMPSLTTPGPTCGWARVRVWRHGHWVPAPRLALLVIAFPRETKKARQVWRAF